ncbi:MAG: glucose-6-phosphate isomerase [Caldilineales bacterium]|nr:glucose-6-phosphate isomerase [Caldilineales bacterium]
MSFHFESRLHGHEKAVAAALAEMTAANLIPRLWDHDFTLWAETPTEISDRLGWLRLPGNMPYNVERMQALLAAARAAGYTQALLLGMGGSSLAPEVFAKTFGLHSAHPPAGLALALQVLDSTHPANVLAQARRLDPATTLFILSTKSGGTVETLSFFKYFYNWASAALGPEEAAARFIAITDPGSSLERLARQHAFRAIFLNDPTLGGRYSALSFFGLLPAVLAGVDVRLLLARAAAAAQACARIADNPGLQLGAILAELAKAGRDKVTFIPSPALASFGDWAEQLIAESTGKAGVGILPVVGEPLASPDHYGPDRLFVHLRLAGDTGADAALDELAAAGHPLLSLHLADPYDLGGQFFLWEMATAVAGHRLGIQPFDQPNVESAKVLARSMMKAYEASGALPAPTPLFTAGDVQIFGDWPSASASAAAPAAAPASRAWQQPADALAEFLRLARPGDYLALQAYTPVTPAIDAALAELRRRLRDRLKLATTLGYGPRFLHSTGQLHKGDAGNGLFVQITTSPEEDVAIPDHAGAEASSISFGVLNLSQALGDGQALTTAGRRLIRLHFQGDLLAGLHQLSAI